MIGHFGYLETAVREPDARAMGFPMHWTLLLSRFNSGLDFKRSAGSICLFDPARNSKTNPAPEILLVVDQGAAGTSAALDTICV